MPHHDAVPASLAGKIRKARERLGMTQVQLARAINADRSSISNWENGKHKPFPAQLAALESVLGPLDGDPEDLYSIADDIRHARELSPGQRQVLLTMIGEQPAGRHTLVPAIRNV